MPDHRIYHGGAGRRQHNHPHHTAVGQDKEAAVKMTTTMPLPRAIQLVMAIVWSSSESDATTTTPPSTKTTIGDFRAGPVLWLKLVLLSPTFISVAAGNAYAMLRDGGGGGREPICSVVIPVLVFVFLAVVEATGGHLGLFAPRTPFAAWQAFHAGMCYAEIGILVAWTSIGIWAFRLIDQAWPLLVAWTCLLVLLILSVIALWLCLLRTYGDGGGERRRRRRENGSSVAEAVIDGLACLYSRLLYEYAVRFETVVADADAGMQPQLDAALLI